MTYQQQILTLLPFTAADYFGAALFLLFIAVIATDFTEDW